MRRTPTRRSFRDRRSNVSLYKRKSQDHIKVKIATQVTRASSPPCAASQLSVLCLAHCTVPCPRTSKEGPEQGVRQISHRGYTSRQNV